MNNVEVNRPPLRYHGGKWLLARWIISNFPKHEVYVEPFGGGASVLLQKSRANGEVYNDIWETVVNVFRVLREPYMAQELKRRIELTPFSRVEFDLCNSDYIKKQIDPVERARLTILRSLAGFGSASVNGYYSTGFRANSNRSGSTPARDFANYPAHIDSFVERLRGVIIECRPYADIMRQHDTPKTLHYLDPPYVHATRNMKRGNAAYAFEFTDDDHRQFAQVCHEMKGMVIISGYDSPLYDELFPGWKKVQVRALADSASERTEILWLNKLAATNQPQQQLFDE